MNIVTKEQMRQIELNSLQYEMTFYRLMENAGSAAAALIRRTFQLRDLSCMVFCGTGNNGGDGFVVARKLAENGANVLIVLVDGVPKSDDALSMYTKAGLMELPMADFGQDKDAILGYLPHIDIVVDAMYGTGFRDRLDAKYAEACATVNSAIAAIIALDVPTGVECDTGRADPHAVRADFTIAFDSLKPLHVIPSCAEFCGKVELVDIGIPQAARKDLSISFATLHADMVFAHLPPRASDSHKGAYGRLLNFAGSSHYRGAAILSTLGALRSGAGIVTLASIEAVCAAAATQLMEATLLPLPETVKGTIRFDTPTPDLVKTLKSASAVLFGCGIRCDADTACLLAWVLKNAGCPVVVDADGINILSENIHLIKEATAPLILTPHPGEMARLCGVKSADIQRDRYGHAMSFAKEHGVTVVLKGSNTLIALPDGGLYVNPTGNAGLAKGGSGDVLAGMIAAFAAQGVEPSKAAACGVYLHGLAADRAAKRLSQYAMLPHELLADLAQIFLENGR